MCACVCVNNIERKRNHEFEKEQAVVLIKKELNGRTGKGRCNYFILILKRKKIWYML